MFPRSVATARRLLVVLIGPIAAGSLGGCGTVMGLLNPKEAHFQDITDATDKVYIGTRIMSVALAKGPPLRESVGGLVPLQFGVYALLAGDLVLCAIADTVLLPFTLHESPESWGDMGR